MEGRATSYPILIFYTEILELSRGSWILPCKTGKPNVNCKVWFLDASFRMMMFCKLQQPSIFISIFRENHCMSSNVNAISKIQYAICWGTKIKPISLIYEIPTCTFNLFWQSIFHIYIFWSGGKEICVLSKSEFQALTKYVSKSIKNCILFIFMQILGTSLR